MLSRMIEVEVCWCSDHHPHHIHSVNFTPTPTPTPTSPHLLLNGRFLESEFRALASSEELFELEQDELADLLASDGLVRSHPQLLLQWIRNVSIWELEKATIRILFFLNPYPGLYFKIRTVVSAGLSPGSSKKRSLLTVPHICPLWYTATKFRAGKSTPKSAYKYTTAGCGGCG